MSIRDVRIETAEAIVTSSGLPVSMTDDVSQMFETPKNPEFGDLALNCNKLRRYEQFRGLDAETISGTIYTNLQGYPNKPDWLSPTSHVGAYVNLTTFTGSRVAEALRGVLENAEDCGSSNAGAGRTIVIEYSSVNIAKPFGIGHLRSTIIGAALNRVHKKFGYRTISINHIGDWGTQFGNLIAAYRLWGGDDGILSLFATDPMSALYKLYTKFHKVMEDDPKLAEAGREEFRKLEQGDEENLQLWKRFIDYSMADFNRIYETLGVKFDHLTGESFYGEEMQRTFAELEEKGLLKESEGAIIVDLSAYDMPPCLIKKGDGSTLYSTRDIAALLYRKRTFHFDEILYVVGTAQKLHFRQFFKVAELMGHEWIKDHAHHIDFGWVKFGQRAMSTRSGTLIFFNDVLQEAKLAAKEIIMRENPEVHDVDWTAEKVAVAAIIFTQLKVRRNKDVNFVWEEALSFTGDTGPYLQYTHARLSSLSRKYGKSLPDLDADFTLLGEEEKQVIKLFELYPSKVEQVAITKETSLLADYLLQLAAAMNSYWQRIRILTDNVELTRARMQMAYAVRVILADGLRLLGIEPLERM